ncbi:MAG: PilZ domain-containing protein [Desulfobaccales bacterium]
MEERRRDKRISVFLEIKEINNQPMGGTYLLNVSETGAKIETPIRYNSGDPVEFSFILPDMAKEIHRRGHVVWVLPHPSKPEHFLVGLDFSTPWEIGRRAK